MFSPKNMSPVGMFCEASGNLLLHWNFFFFFCIGFDENLWGRFWGVKKASQSSNINFYQDSVQFDKLKSKFGGQRLILIDPLYKDVIYC